MGKPDGEPRIARIGETRTVDPQIAQIYTDFLGTLTRIKLPFCLTRPDGISDTEGKLVAGNREQAQKRASLKVPHGPSLLSIFCGDRPVVVPDLCLFASIPSLHFYIRKLRDEVLKNL